jgi:hypothetical protein
VAFPLFAAFIYRPKWNEYSFPEGRVLLTGILQAIGFIFR